MYAFGLLPFSLYDAYIKPPCRLPPPPPTHTCYHHLTYNDFKFLPIKSYQLLIQLKTDIAFPTFLTLDFALLLVALRNRLKFHINLVQGFKKLLSGFLDLSFYSVTITFTFSFLQYKFIVLDVIIVFEIDEKP